jgi:Zn-dependent peptidase ImmA (M78 family)
LVRAALEEADEDQELWFVGSFDISRGVDDLVGSMRQVLGVTVQEFRAQKSATDAFAFLRMGAERAGVFVLLMGNLGTHHTDIDVRVFRGFALADRVAPFVVINEKDSRAAWSFSLLHELAHIWLGKTGVSGYDSEADVERFCDSVAARFLLDPRELEEFGTQPSGDANELNTRITEFASVRNLSRKMVAYNLLRSGIIAASAYRRLSNFFDAERAAMKKEEGKEGGPDYYVVRRHRLGPGLTSLVRRMVATGALSIPKAGKVLGVKPTAVDKIVTVGRLAGPPDPDRGSSRARAGG